MTTNTTPNADVVLGSSATLVFNSGMTTQFVVTKATVTNTDTAAHTVTCYRVPPGGSAAASNIIGADALSIGAGATVTLPLSGQSFIGGQSLQALASTANVVNLNVSLVQIL